METVRYLAWQLAETGSLVFYLWPVSLVVLGAFMAAFFVGAPLGDRRFRRSLRLLAAAYLIPPVILLIGALLRYELHGPPHPDWRRPPDWFFYLLQVPILLHLVVLAGCLIALKGLRLRALGALLPGIWLSLCAYLIAASTVNGVGP